MATGPKPSRSPLELFTTPCPIEPPFLNKFWGPMIVGVIAGGGSIVTNFFAKRPLVSGAQRHVLFTLAGIAVGKFLDDYRMDYFAERDASFRHYIELHPEDFPPYNRKKYADVIEQWVPIR